MRKYTISLLFLFITAFPAFSQWNSNTTVNNIVANSDRDELIAATITDGANGSILFFQDYNTNYDIFTQKISSAGVIAWGSTANPVQVCVTLQEKGDLNAIPDGNGGAFIAWSDFRSDANNAEIYIQRINSAGVVQWGANGLRVTNSPALNDQEPVLCSDGAGGVIIAWYWDDTIHKNIQSSAQRYNGSGAAQWAVNGVQVSTAPGFRGANAIVTDGNNGVIIFFVDTRNDPHGLDYDYLKDGNNDLANADIYAQRLNGSGTRQWTSNGAAIVTAGGNQQPGKVIPDGSGGAILVFDDGRNDNAALINNDIFVQRVNGNGTVQWTANGVAVCTAAGNQFLTSAVSDGAGGVIIAFEFSSGEIYSQRILASGTASWAANGVAAILQTDQAYSVQIVVDGNSNTIFAYTSSDNNGATVKAQKLSGAGALQWPAEGIVISNAEIGYPSNANITISDNGSAIISWNDTRNLASPDAYASKVLANGILAGSAITNYVSAANGNWNNPATWVGGIVPPAGAAVVIHNVISCNVNTSCTSLKIEQPGGNLTVLPGFKITITN